MMLGGGDACVARRPHHTRIVPMATTGDASVPTPHPPNPRPYRMEIRMREDERATQASPRFCNPPRGYWRRLWKGKKGDRKSFTPARCIVGKKGDRKGPRP